jgi:hypothetical protein
MNVVLFDIFLGLLAIFVVETIFRFLVVIVVISHLEKIGKVRVRDKKIISVLIEWNPKELSFFLFGEREGVPHFGHLDGEGFLQT